MGTTGEDKPVLGTENTPLLRVNLMIYVPFTAQRQEYLESCCMESASSTPSGRKNRNESCQLERVKLVWEGNCVGSFSKLCHDSLFLCLGPGPTLGL